MIKAIYDLIHELITSRRAILRVESKIDQLVLDEAELQAIAAQIRGLSNKLHDAVKTAGG